MIPQRVDITVPASIGNLGSCFDCAALSLRIFNRFTFLRSRATAVRSWVPSVPEGRDNLVFRSFARTLALLQKKPFPVSILIEGDIPPARGLGSSSTAVIAGTAAAFLLSGLRPSRRGILEAALAVERHPDNLAAAVYGGFVLVSGPPAAPMVVALRPPSLLSVVLFIPEQSFPTEQSRRLLPRRVSRKDAVSNLFSAGCLSLAFSTGRLELLGPGTSDRLHQPYRFNALPHVPRVIRCGIRHGALAGCLSGAGPSVALFTASDPHQLCRALAGDIRRIGVPGTLRVAQCGGQVRWRLAGTFVDTPEMR